MSEEENHEVGPVQKVRELKEGDRILFGDRATPLEVESVENEEAVVNGPNGGEYLLYDEEDAKHPLVAKPGSKKYSSYAENLRKVGEWKKKDENTWRHTGTGAEIRLERNSIGYWNIQVSDFEEQDTPMYGFTDRENAQNEVEKIVASNPEG